MKLKVKKQDYFTFNENFTFNEERPPNLLLVNLIRVDVSQEARRLQYKMLVLHQKSLQESSVREEGVDEG